jgi:hypothetical protein
MSDIVTDTQPQKNQRLEVGLKIQVSRAVQLKEMPWKWAKYSVTTLKEKKTKHIRKWRILKTSVTKGIRCNQSIYSIYTSNTHKTTVWDGQASIFWVFPNHPGAGSRLGHLASSAGQLNVWLRRVRSEWTSWATSSGEALQFCVVFNYLSLWRPQVRLMVDGVLSSHQKNPMIYIYIWILLGMWIPMFN